jgi:hypothetical protein
MVMKMEGVMTVVDLDTTDLHTQFVAVAVAVAAVENVIGTSRV